MLGVLTQVGKSKIARAKITMLLPTGIVLKSNLTSRSLPILDLTPTRVNPLVMIIPLPHCMGYILTILEVYSLPGTYLSVNVLYPKWVQYCIGCGLTLNMSTVKTA